MGHDASKLLLGATASSDRVVTRENGDPATFLAGLAVRRASTDELSLSSGSLIGVSLGRDLSDTKKTAVCRAGNLVPIRITDESAQATGTVTITSYANLVDAGADEITVGPVTFVAQSGAVTPGQATFQAASSDEATAASLAAQINAHEDLDGIVTAEDDGDEVTITAVEAGVAGNSIALTYSDEGTATVGATVSGSGNLEGGADAFPYVEIGAAVEVGATTGMAVSNDVATGAKYMSGPMKGIDPITGTEYDCAQIDMGGGL